MTTKICPECFQTRSTFEFLGRTYCKVCKNKKDTATRRKRVDEQPQVSRLQPIQPQLTYVPTTQSSPAQGQSIQRLDPTDRDPISLEMRKRLVAMLRGLNNTADNILTNPSYDELETINDKLFEISDFISYLKNKHIYLLLPLKISPPMKQYLKILYDDHLTHIDAAGLLAKPQFKDLLKKKYNIDRDEVYQYKDELKNIFNFVDMVRTIYHILVHAHMATTRDTIEPPRIGYAPEISSIYSETNPLHLNKDTFLAGFKTVIESNHIGATQYVSLNWHSQFLAMLDN